MRRIRSTPAGFALVAAVLCAEGVPARPDDAAPLAPPKTAGRIAAAAQSLAGKGRRAEADALIDVLAALHEPGRAVEALRQSAAKALAKAKPVAGPLPDVAKSLQKTAAELAVALPSLEDAGRRELAAQILRIDSSQADAHAALGEVEHEGGWVPEAVVPALLRRREIQIAAQRARRLEFDFEEKESDIAVLERIQGARGRMVVCRNVAIHSNDFTPAQAVREGRAAMRAYALSNWLRTGSLDFPALPKRLDMVLVARHEDYLKAVRAALAQGEITASDARLAETLTGYIFGSYRLFGVHHEPEIRVFALFHVLNFAQRWVKGSIYQPALVAGHLDWLYASFLGVQMPAVGSIETLASGAGGRATRDAPGAADERTEMLRLAKAGIFGTRSWMRWLVTQREDPPWARAIVPDLAQIEGGPLLKSAIVVEYLQETGEFGKLFEETAGKPFEPATFDGRLPGGLAALETRWREWLFAGAGAPGLVQLLSGAARGGPTAEETAVVARLTEIRKAACFRPDRIDADAELSAGCRAHALYLQRHPEQQRAWPDVHEERPDEPDFSAAGSRAGLNSVIYSGMTRSDQALDGWMGTFFHRLPLIHPHLLRIGWALDGGIAVLDASSVVGESDTGSFARWPGADARDVPRRFVPEMPNPVPGEDQAAWGHPVTLQVWVLPAPDIRLRLHAGTSRGSPEVPCHFTSPRSPLNPELVPADAWCLIPKAPLAGNSVYTVAVDGSTWTEVRDWSFTTGK